MSSCLSGGDHGRRGRSWHLGCAVSQTPRARRPSCILPRASSDWREAICRPATSTGRAYHLLSGAVGVIAKIPMSQNPYQSPQFTGREHGLPALNVGGPREYRYRKHVRWMQYALPITQVVIALLPWIALLVLVLIYNLTWLQPAQLRAISPAVRRPRTRATPPSD